MNRFVHFLLNYLICIFQVGAKDKDVKIIGKKVFNFSKKVDSLFLKPYDSFRKLKRKNVAIFCEGIAAREYIPKLFASHQICDTRKILFPQNTIGGILVKKKFPLRERLLINWLWMNEAGIVIKINHHWKGDEIKCESKTHFDYVDIHYVALTLVLLFVSYILSVIILCVEIYTKKIKRKCIY